ncbi:CLUMA_CG000508, isoform A [Clunio marinus]|uniref:CLUMA_CG000508, isoform A n=1 Tax=Clunio marinus TaxID=568069 RepID=A0A1J1HFB0_9DIPT|nr:CLUMA_CG000508, isoform A [Clunio marinus]
MKFVCILAFCALASAQIQEWPAQPQPIPEIDNLEWPAQPNPRPHPRPEHNDPEQHPEWQEPQPPQWNPNAPQWRADERPTRDQRCEPAHSRNSIVFAHDFDCSLFHECRDGLRFTFQCQGNFLFDRVTMTCRHPRSARC